MTNNLKHPRKKTTFKINRLFLIMAGLWGVILISFFTGMYLYDIKYRGLIYPLVFVDGIDFSSQPPKAVEKYFEVQNVPFQQINLTLTYGDIIATVSGDMLDIGYDATLSATQAYLIGRSGGITADFINKFPISIKQIRPFFRYKTAIFDDVLDQLSGQINIPPQDALFAFENNKVTAFRPSTDGLELNQAKARELLENALNSVSKNSDLNIVLNLPVEKIEPLAATDEVNSFGIKEHIGKGYSEFRGSISGRIHNVALAASRFNGVLIPPGEVMSFNQTLGDVSAATGYQSAYIIKAGRTVLGDGGGVCQVSTTLFRAALDAGLTIIDRSAHAYRVHYYEEGGYKPGLDATFFDPTVDLKIKNDTPAHILIQTKTDTKNLTLVFDLYGTSDGRQSEIYDHQVWGITPPPPDLYQDDPTLKTGEVKQVDWSAWGAKAKFNYKVTRGGEILEEREFFSNYRPWQAVYLRGTME